MVILGLGKNIDTGIESVIPLQRWGIRKIMIRLIKEAINIDLKISPVSQEIGLIFQEKYFLIT